MSDEAYELIQCFYDGVDVVVRELAEEIAQERGSYLDDDKKIIAIETDDVREAGKRVLESLKSLLKDGTLPDELENSLRMMDGCFDHHAS